MFKRRPRKEKFGRKKENEGKNDKKRGESEGGGRAGQRKKGHILFVRNHHF